MKEKDDEKIKQLQFLKELAVFEFVNHIFVIIR